MKDQDGFATPTPGGWLEELVHAANHRTADEWGRVRLSLATVRELCHAFDDVVEHATGPAHGLTIHRRDTDACSRVGTMAFAAARLWVAATSEFSDGQRVEPPPLPPGSQAYGLSRTAARGTYAAWLASGEERVLRDLTYPGHSVAQIRTAAALVRLRTDFARLLHSYRTGANRLSLDAAGALAGVSGVTWSRWERGTHVPNRAALERLAEGLGTYWVTADDLEDLLAADPPPEDR